MIRICFFLIILLFFGACESSKEEENQEDDRELIQRNAVGNQTIPIRQLSKNEYPDNPDWEERHSHYDHISYQHLLLTKNTSDKYTFTFIPKNKKTDTLILSELPLMEFIPFVPPSLTEDDYLTKIGIINQEWNRQQVWFNKEEVELKGGYEQFDIQRIDLARNCLNAYLWELILYAEDIDGELRPYYHGWFEFPKDLYAQLFNQRNPSLDYEDFRPMLENWQDPANQPLDLAKLRSVDQEWAVDFEVHNDQLYPLAGARKSKQKNIVHPAAKDISSIQDFLNDSTQFATFSPPGYYNTKDPRSTELSRFAKLEKVLLRATTSRWVPDAKTFELEYQFRRKGDNSLLRMVVGGLQAQNFHHLKVEEANKGWKMPMGIANHSFYESYEQYQQQPCAQNPYFAVLLDEQGNWLDSHKVGIDGPLFHLDIQEEKDLLHLWILSFERHAFAGHISSKIRPLHLKHHIHQ